MGSLSYRRQPLALAQLVGSSSGIALVRPADPPRVIEARTVTRDPAVPPWLGAASVAYNIAYDRYQVIEWLREPLAAPAVIEVAARENEASARDAHDAAMGMLGHVHHLVIEADLDVPAAWRDQPDDRRLLFLSPQPGPGTDTDKAAAPPPPPRFALVHGQVLGPAALDAVRALLPPPRAPRRPARWPRIVGAAVILGAVALLIARCWSRA